MFTSTYIHRVGVLSLGLIIALSFPITAFAGDISVDLHWHPNPEPDVAGYNVYHGTTSGVYGLPDKVQNSTSHHKGSLDPMKTHYFAITAYDNAGNESAPTAEVKTPTPSVSAPSAPPTSLPPASLPPGVVVERVTVIKNVGTNKNSFVTRTDIPNTVQDGTLSLTLGGSGSTSMLNYMVINPTGQ